MNAVHWALGQRGLLPVLHRQWAAFVAFYWVMSLTTRLDGAWRWPCPSPPEPVNVTFRKRVFVDVIESRILR